MSKLETRMLQKAMPRVKAVEWALLFTHNGRRAEHRTGGETTRKGSES